MAQPPASSNLVATASRVTAEHRQARNRHAGGVLWFTGLPGSGKTTLAVALEHRLFEAGAQVYVLDGDRVRRRLSSDLGFTPADRSENIRRTGELAALFADAGLIVIVAFISPYRNDRAAARIAAGKAFHEVYIKAPLEVCEARDPKGHYRKARAGEIADFTGVSAPYEAPEAPDLVIETDKLTVEESLARLMEFARAKLQVG
jgi:bifunctional enzyme CysN/CysC